MQANTCMSSNAWPMRRAMGRCYSRKWTTTTSALNIQAWFSRISDMERLEEDEPLSNDWTYGGLWPHDPHWAAKGQDALLPRASPSGQ